jgi:uncharacterized protein YktB (UPF0637 family)
VNGHVIRTKNIILPKLMSNGGILKDTILCKKEENFSPHMSGHMRQSLYLINRLSAKMTSTIIQYLDSAYVLG